MLAGYLTGLRGGLQAALVLGVLVAYVVRTGHRTGLPAVRAGVSAAVAMSLGVGALLTVTAHSLSFEAQEVFGAATSVVAACFVTRVAFSRQLQAPALAATAFIVVVREGLEAALLVFSALSTTGSSVRPLLGTVLALATEVLLGYLVCRCCVGLDRVAFVRVTGAGLIVVAAGLLAYAVQDVQNLGLLSDGGLGHEPFDASDYLDPSSWRGTLAAGLLGISAAPTVLELGSWLAYLLPAIVLLLRTPAGEPASPTHHERSPETTTVLRRLPPSP